MLLELYITLLVIDVVCFGIAFFRKNIWFWAICLVISAALMFSSFNIVQNIAIVENQTQPSPGIIQYQYGVMTNTTQDTGILWLISGMFLISLVLFLWDLFGGLKEGNLGDRKY